MGKLLTISVAAYNIEPYIDKLMQSIIKSKHLDDIEVLIVDDGSKDKTKEIAECYVSSFPCSIDVISKPNGGHGSTINTGIEYATAKYFKAIDGDDWVDTAALDHLIDILPYVNDDMIICDYSKCYSDGRVEVLSFDSVPYNTSLAVDKIIKEIRWIPYHSIVYKTEILKNNNIRLDEHCFYVDSEYDIFPLPFVKTMYYFNEPIYCYRLGLTDQSISPQSRIKHIDNAYTVAHRLVEMYNTNAHSLSLSMNGYVLRAVADQCLWYIESLFLFKAQRRYQNQIVDFDMEIKQLSPTVFSFMEKLGNDSRTIKTLRKTAYKAYWPLYLYKMFKHKRFKALD